MRNYLSSSELITISAPTAVVSGQIFPLKDLILIATSDAKEGQLLAAYTQGCFQVPIQGSVVEGSPLYYSNGSLTVDGTSKNSIFCGYAYSDCGGGVWKILLTNAQSVSSSNPDLTLYAKTADVVLKSDFNTTLTKALADTTTLATVKKALGISA